MASGDQRKPTPADLARLAASRGASVAGLPVLTPVNGVLFSYVDNSNVWIEGQRIQAVEAGRARSPYDAMQRGITAAWSYDFGRLYEFVCPPGTPVGRSILVGSRPPPNDSVWARAEAEGFQVEVFDRNVANKEKQVDSYIVTKMLEDSFIHMKPDRGDMAVLVAGDGDYVPSVSSLQERCIPVRVIFWKHATSGQLRDAAAEFVELDPLFDSLTFSP